MTQKTKRTIAVIELVIVVALVAYFFLPRHFDGAMSGNFDRETVTAVQVVLTGRGDQEDGREAAIQPGTPAYEELIALLDSKQYQPYYVGEGPRTPSLPYTAELTFTTPGGEYAIAFCGDLAMDFTGSDVRPRTFRVSDSEAFQQELLEFLLTL